jgi:hypothetical protein
MDNIEQFFKDNLDGKIAYIQSGGLRIEGTIEQKCKLEFEQFRGLHCYTKLKDNKVKIIKNIENILITEKEIFEITYNSRNQTLQRLTEELDTMYILCGTLNYYGIKNISSSYSEDNIATEIIIEYNDKSTVRIYNIK